MYNMYVLVLAYITVLHNIAYVCMFVYTIVKVVFLHVSSNVVYCFVFYIYPHTVYFIWKLFSESDCPEDWCPDAQEHLENLMRLHVNSEKKAEALQ